MSIEKGQCPRADEGRSVMTLAQRTEAARCVLRTYAALVEVEEGEPRQLDGNHVDLGAPESAKVIWLRWYADSYQPAAEAWNHAMDKLAAELGADFPGRHPWDFLPACLRIVRESWAGGGR